MQIRWVGYRVKGFLGVADRGLYWDMICKSAEQRLNVLRFWERHGGRNCGAGKPHTLAPRSTRPNRLRRRSWWLALMEEIRGLRSEHPNLTKEKLHPFVRAFCLRKSLPIPSVRTIGRLIADAPRQDAPHEGQEFGKHFHSALANTAP